MFRWIFILCSFFPSLAFADVIVDRIVLKINDSAFTQRELETYLLVKAVRKKQRELVATQENWERAVKYFKNDMLIHEESRKLKYPVETPATLPQDVKDIQASLQADGEWKALADRLLINEKDIEAVVRMLLRVEKYKGEQRETSLDTVSVPPARRVPFLEKRNYVRFYDDAMSYRRIEPRVYKFHK